MHGRPLRHIPALDGLRGLGVMGVLLFHANHLRGGWLGVDLFFVLSGFLITSLLLEEFERTGDVSIRRFWARRARRLFPALLLALFGVAAYAARWAPPEQLARIRSDGLATLFYVANWHSILAGHDYWALFRAPSPLHHTWSLAIEEQFYLIWPPLALVLLRWRRSAPRKTLLISALLLGVLSAIWMALLFDPEAGTARVYFGTDTRCFATLVGAALAALGPWQPGWRVRHSNWPVDALGALLASALAWAWWTLPGSAPGLYRGGLFAHALLVALLIAVVSRAPGSSTARLCSLPPLRALGVISYGAYLWHWPLYIALDEGATGLQDPALTALRIGVTLAIATASYFVVERPIRAGALGAFSATTLATTATGLLCAALVFATTSADRSAREVANGAREDCERLLVGDSVAARLAHAFRVEGRARDHPSRTQAMLGCTQVEADRVRFASGDVWDLTPCRAFRKRWRRFVQVDAPRTVVLLDGWPGGGERRLEHIWRHPCDEGFERIYSRRLESVVAFLRRSGARAVLVSVPPPIVDDLSATFRKALGGGLTGSALARDLSASTDCQNRIRRQTARRAGAGLIDLASWVCPQGRCRREVDGVVLRPDGVHFGGPSTRIVARWLHDRIDELETCPRRQTSGDSATTWPRDAQRGRPPKSVSGGPNAMASRKAGDGPSSEVRGFVICPR